MTARPDESVPTRLPQPLPLADPVSAALRALAGRTGASELSPEVRAAVIRHVVSVRLRRRRRLLSLVARRRR